MSTRNVVLSEHQHDLAETLVQSGHDQNASEVRRLIEQREHLEAAKLKNLQQVARVGWSDIAVGRYTDIADDRLENAIGQLGQQAARAAS